MVPRSETTTLGGADASKGGKEERTAGSAVAGGALGPEIGERGEEAASMGVGEGEGETGSSIYCSRPLCQRNNDAVPPISSSRDMSPD